MNFSIPHSSRLAARVLAIRIEHFGEGEAGLLAVATELDLPPRTWANYEDGVTMPATIMLPFLVATRANPSWLMSGIGERYLASPVEGRLSLKGTRQDR